MVFAFVLGALVAMWFVCLHLMLELHQRDVHLQWTDDRDLEFARFFEKAWALTLLPKNNPLDGLKQHGMLAKDAFMRAEQIIPMLDERLDAMNGATTGLVRSAKSLMLWEQMHPMPPKHYWQTLKKRKTDGRLSERPHSEQSIPQGPQLEDHRGSVNSNDRPGGSQAAVGPVPDHQATD